MKNEIPFASGLDRPQDALNNVRDVLDMIKTFLAAADDLTLFQRSENHDPISGFYTVLEACSVSIGIASNDMCEQLRRSVDLESAVGLVPELAHTDRLHREAWRSGFNAGVEAYREHGDSAPGDTREPENEMDTVSTSKPGIGTEGTYPRLTARDHAIASAVKEGYDLPEVAKAVNLKKATVERIVAKLRDDGVLPQADAESETPQSASA